MSTQTEVEVTQSGALEVAAAIAYRVAQQSAWHGDQCTWMVAVADRAAGPGQRRSVRETAGPSIYQGTAGIGLFLSYAFEMTREPRFLECAGGALSFAADKLESARHAPLGFHSGQIGVAYALGIHGSIAQREDQMDAARLIVRSLAGSVERDRNYDIIGGSAGAIAPLLRLSYLLDFEDARDIALRCGEHLVRSANRGIHGWSWGTPAPWLARDLTGYAHGVAGIAHALLELYAATGDSTFRYAAEQGFAYERAFFDADLGNWPDFRHTEILERAQANGGYSELERQIRAGALVAPSRASFMCAWCHGAAGIGLSRLRAYDVLRHPCLAEEAEIAARTTAEELTRGWGNFSLCHGAAGNCETLLLAGSVLGDANLALAAKDLAAEAALRFEGTARAWPCGTTGAVSDPSLLVGESGIGYFFLRLAYPELPSVLLLTAPEQPTAPPIDDSGARREREAYVRGYFARSIDAMGVSDQQEISLLKPQDVPAGDAAHLFSLLSEHQPAPEDPTVQQRFADAFALERARFELARRAPTRSDEFLRRCQIPPFDAVDWSSTLIVLAPDAVLVTTDDGMDQDGEDGRPSTERSRTYVVHVLYCSQGYVRQRSLSRLAGATLLTARTPITCDEAVERVAAALTEVDRLTLREAVASQIRSAYDAGILVGVSFGSSEMPS